MPFQALKDFLIHDTHENKDELNVKDNFYNEAVETDKSESESEEDFLDKDDKVLLDIPMKLRNVYLQQRANIVGDSYYRTEYRVRIHTCT